MARSTLVLKRPPRLSFQITKRWIDEAVPKNSGVCMIAESLREAHPELHCISVDTQTIRASDPGKGLRYIWLTPRKVQSYVLYFDYGQRSKLKPIKVILPDNGQVTTMDTWYLDAAGKVKKSNQPKRRLRAKMTRPNAPGARPSIVGGREPPLLRGTRRVFGMRNLGFMLEQEKKMMRK